MSDPAPYLATVVEHYRRPHNQRSLSTPTCAHEGVNALCGDRVRIELDVRDGVLRDAAFAASACAIAAPLGWRTMLIDPRVALLDDKGLLFHGLADQALSLFPHRLLVHPPHPVAIMSGVL